MEFGLVLSQFGAKWDYVAGDAEAAERHGLDSVWLADHLLAPFGAEGDVFEAWTALAVLAGATERVRLGHLVNCVSFRNVGLLAKMAATLDHASGGRLELGLGAGWYEREYTAFGWDFPPPAARVAAFREAVEALDLLFRGGPVDFDGAHVRLAEAYCHPVPVQRPRPPFVFGTGGEVMRRLTGQLADTWNCPGGLLPDFARAREVVMEAAAGRPVRTTLQIPVAVGRTRDEADAALAVARSHLAWLGDIEAVGLVGTVEQAAEKAREYRDQGADGFICVLPGSPRRPDFIAALGDLKQAI